MRKYEKIRKLMNCDGFYDGLKMVGYKWGKKPAVKRCQK
jgi:hypothetical protein